MSALDAEPGYVIALAHAARGRRVFPWRPLTEPGKTKPTKKPLTEHGHLDATTDERTIIDWWKRWPNAYAGWALPDGIGLVDVDDPEKAAGLDLPDAPEQRGTLTRPDGLHRIYAVPDGRQTQGEVPGVDTRVGGFGWVALYSADAFEGVPPPAPDWFPRGERGHNGSSPLPIKIANLAARRAIEDRRLFIPKGRRDGDLASIAGTLIEAGATADAAELALSLLDAAGAVERIPGDTYDTCDFHRIAQSVARKDARNGQAVSAAIGTRTALDLRHGTPPDQLADPYLTPEGPTVIYAKGGTGKGTVACWLVKRLVAAGHVVMVVDFEGHEREWGSRLRGLGLTDDELSRVHYRAPFGADWTAPTGSLATVADAIAADTKRLGVTFLIVDSYSVATSNGDTMGGEAAAREYFSGLARIGLPSGTIAHVRGDSGKFPDRPFGSVFVHNLARETWAVERVGDDEPEADPDLIRVGPHVVALELRNKKANARPISAAQFVTFSFFGDGSIEVQTDAPTGRSVADLAASALADGPMTLVKIAAAIKEDSGETVDPATIRKAMKRHPERFAESPSGRPRTWDTRR